MLYVYMEKRVNSNLSPALHIKKNLFTRNSLQTCNQSKKTQKWLTFLLEGVEMPNRVIVRKHASLDDLRHGEKNGFRFSLEFFKNWNFKYVSKHIVLLFTFYKNHKCHHTLCTCAVYVWIELKVHIIFAEVIFVPSNSIIENTFVFWGG